MSMRVLDKRRAGENMNVEFEGTMTRAPVGECLETELRAAGSDRWNETGDVVANDTESCHLTGKRMTRYALKLHLDIHGACCGATYPGIRLHCADQRMRTAPDMVCAPA
jgi:hypothetical protein